MWVSSGNPCTEVDKLLFAVSTPVTLGDGRKAKFWLSARWHGQRLQDIAPTVFKASRKKNRSVQAALQK
jgi:hypothetical protein